MSLRSFALFKKEYEFYHILDTNPHPNLAQRLQTKQLSGIAIPKFGPVEEVWARYTKEMHLSWIQQLLSALEWLEKLGYIHGDLKVQNLGIDENSRLRLFDFGSVRRHDQIGFNEQVLEDHFALATVIHFLASGIDKAKAYSFAEVQQTRSILNNGQGVIDEAATAFEKVIMEGWMKVPRKASSFSHLCSVVTGIVGQVCLNEIDCSDRSRLQTDCDDIIVETEASWMDEEDYRAAWEREGYTLPPRDLWD
jgi:serine/threonine protein kinase